MAASWRFRVRLEHELDRPPGGEAKGYTKLLSDSRDHATEWLRDAAAEKGANAVLAMRFDCNEIGDIMSEVAAYGTAVTVRPRG